MNSDALSKLVTARSLICAISYDFGGNLPHQCFMLGQAFANLDQAINLLDPNDKLQTIMNTDKEITNG